MSSVRILTLGDPHFKLDPFSLLRSDAMCSAFIALAKKLQPDAIVNLGDTLDRHSVMDMQARCRAVRFLRDLKEIAPLYVLIGNHDRIDNSEYLTDVSPFIGEKEWSNTTIVDDFVEATIKNKRFLFMPYVKEDRILESLERYKDRMEFFAGVFSHIEVEGCKMGSLLSKADKWIYQVPLITGHVHEKQRVGSYVSFPGTPMHMSFGEKTKKTVSLYTFSDIYENREHAWCQTTQGSVSEETFDLGLPPLKTVYLSTREFLKYEENNPRFDPRYTRFSIKGTDPEIRLVKRSERYIAWDSMGVRIAFPAIREQLQDQDQGQGQDACMKQSYQETVEERMKEEEDKVKKMWERLKAEVLK